MIVLRSQIVFELLIIQLSCVFNGSLEFHLDQVIVIWITDIHMRILDQSWSRSLQHGHVNKLFGVQSVPHIHLEGESEPS